MKRSIQFSLETEQDLKRLAIAMHSGNITATVSELIRTECRRRFGDNYDIEPTPEVVTTPQVVSVVKKKKKPTPQVVNQSEAHTTSGVVVDAPSHVPEPPTEASLPDPFTNPIVPAPPDPEVLPPVPQKPVPSGFKVFDPKDPSGSRPDIKKDNDRYLVWFKEKTQYEASRKAKTSFGANRVD